MRGTPPRFWAALTLAAALACPVASQPTPPPAAPAARLERAVARIRSAYLHDRPVEAAEPADDRAALEPLLTDPGVPPEAVASYRAAVDGLARARDVQAGRPPGVSVPDYEGWLSGVARALALDGAQRAQAEALYRGHLRGSGPDGGRPDARGP
ncbi:MAG: hypothetical protein KGM24_08530, partial [Elusimicrobia bacterium]|nr:hypothetical protein [Elusimicrobiota bacterium]